MVAACGIRNRTLPRSLWLTRRERFATVAAVCTLVLGACSAAPTPTSAPTEPVTGSQITPLLDTTLSTPRWFTGTDGQAHLVYELLLTNVIPALVTLHSVEVHDVRLRGHADPTDRRFAPGGHIARRIGGDAERPAAAVVGRRCVAGHSACRDRRPGSDHPPDCDRSPRGCAVTSRSADLRGDDGAGGPATTKRHWPSSGRAEVGRGRQLL